MKRLKLLAESEEKESRYIDFKEGFDSSSSQDWAKIIKDVIAFANSGGGVIIFGIRDDGSPTAFDRKTISRIDPAVIADKISAYTQVNDFKTRFIIYKRNR